MSLFRDASISNYNCTSLYVYKCSSVVKRFVIGLTYRVVNVRVKTKKIKNQTILANYNFQDYENAVRLSFASHNLFYLKVFVEIHSLLPIVQRLLFISNR